jgi:thiol:disulfide interchange protein DsbD
VGAAYGETDLRHPLPKTSVIVEAGEAGGKAKLSGEMPFKEIASYRDYEIKMQEAMDEDKTMVLFFHTDTCPVCKRLRDSTFKDKRVQAILKDEYVALSVNISDKSDKEIEKLKEKFQVFGPPGFVFVDSEGKEIKEAKFYGYQKGSEFYDMLDLIAE